jgi:surface protein
MATNTNDGFGNGAKIAPVSHPRRPLMARLARNSRGASMAEYGIMLSLVGLTAVAAVNLFGEKVSDSFQGSSDQIAGVVDGNGNDAGSGDAGGAGPYTGPSYAGELVPAGTSPADSNCFDPAQVGKIGKSAWPLCKGMLIVDGPTLYEGGNYWLGGDASMRVAHYDDGGAVTWYTYTDDAKNIFTGQVTDMSSLLVPRWDDDKAIFNADVGYWYTGNVTNMRSMFGFNNEFNHDLSGWDTSKVVDMNSMFTNAWAFDQNIGDWDVSNVRDFSGMFSQASSFNSPLTNWNTESATDMSRMFESALEFNQPVAHFKTKDVTNLSAIFQLAKEFNQPVVGWNTTKVEDMSGAFGQATKFNQPLDGWDVGAVDSFKTMFSATSAFDKPLSSWKIKPGADMELMFNYATTFNQDLSGWCVESIPNAPTSFDFRADSWTGIATQRPQWGAPCS